MSPQAAKILVEEIMPIIEGTTYRTVRPLPTEDHEEVLQDTLASAAEMIDSVERAGKLHEVRPNSIAFYAIQRSKSARRSCGHNATDVLSMSYRAIPGNSSLSLDAEIKAGKDSDSTCLLDMLPSRVEDPASICARRIDWEDFMETLDRRSTSLLLGMAKGIKKGEIAKSLGVSGARVSQMKNEIGSKARSFFGVESSSELSDDLSWRKGLRAFYEAKAFEGIKSELAAEA